MALYAYVNGLQGPQPPIPNGRGRCLQESCNHPMFARMRDDALSHWVHFEGSDHSYGTGEKGEWHQSVQDVFEALGANVEREHVNPRGVKHRADIVCPKGSRVVEAQTSFLNEEKVTSRESTYGDMCWLYGDMDAIDKLIPNDRNPGLFTWPACSHRLVAHSVPVFIDRGQLGIWRLVWLERRTSNGEYGTWRCRLELVAADVRAFAEAVVAGNPFGAPPMFKDDKTKRARLSWSSTVGVRPSAEEYARTYHHDRVYGVPDMDRLLADMEMREGIAAANAEWYARKAKFDPWADVRHINAIFYPKVDVNQEQTEKAEAMVEAEFVGTEKGPQSVTQDNNYADWSVA